MLTLAEVGENETVGVIVPNSRNKFGEYEFTLYWRANYHPGHPEGENRLAVRGQCYLARPETYPNVRWL